MDSNSRKIFLSLLLSAGFLLFFFNLGGRDLWDPDETRYALVAREMREGGNWILPHLNGALYAEKPPLFFWLVNLSVFFLGEDSEFSNRLPSALAGLMTLVVTFLMGERLFNTRAGFLSGLVLASCFLFPHLSRWMMLDSLFTLLFLLSLFFLYRGFENEERRSKDYLFAGFFTGVGVLTKGPAIYLSFPILFSYALIRKRAEKAWNRDLFSGFILSVAVVSLWLLPACWIGGDPYRERILFEQNLGRLAGSGRHFHPQPIYFYLSRFPLEFLPWSLFLPGAFLWGLREGGPERKASLFLIVWFAIVFLFFTFSKGKKDNYILPLYPAAALMVGALWDGGLGSRERDKKFLLPLVFLGSFSLLGFAGLVCGIPDRFFPALRAYHSVGLLIGFYLGLGLVLSTFFSFKRKMRASFVCLLATFSFLHLHLSHTLPERLNEQRSMKAFSGRVLKRMEPGDELKVCFFRPAGLIYYTRIPFVEEIRDQRRFQEVFESPGRVFMVIQRKDLDQLQKDLKREILPIEEERVWHWDLVLLSNR